MNLSKFRISIKGKYGKRLKADEICTLILVIKALIPPKYCAHRNIWAQLFKANDVVS